MVLSLRSVNSFVHLNSAAFQKTSQESPSIISLSQIRAYPRLQITNSMQGLQSSFGDNSSLISERMENKTTERLHTFSDHDSLGGYKVPVYVMLPLDTVTLGGKLSNPRALNVSLMALKSAGVEGVMVDAWWGIVEKDGPQKYNWEPYAELVKMVQKHGLKLQVVMSFHQCGGNVGDSCCIPLPPWVLQEIEKDPDLVYTDKSGRRNPEYISLGCDTLPVLRGRTPIQVYEDYMRSFRDRFTNYLGHVVVEIQVGMGPCGELRYPSYPESNGTWKFPGIGEFQCYDKFMRASLAAAAEAIGKKEWGHGPHDFGEYRKFPEETGFFRKDGTWSSEFGQFFLEWYAKKLLDHGDQILSSAAAIFRGAAVKLSGKVAGIHWHYTTRSHAAELTAGYYNTRQRDGYLTVAQMFSKYGVIFNFTCMEMRDNEQPEYANSSPEGLVKQVTMTTSKTGTQLAGENALARYDERAFAQVLETSRSEHGNGLVSFTYLRMCKALFEEHNWINFVKFVKNMAEGGRRTNMPSEDRIGTNLYVGHIKRTPSDKEASLV